MSIQDLKEDIVFQENLRGFPLIFHSTWGLFSAAEIDEGTRLLIDTMDIQSTDLVLDLGCGYGALGIIAAKLAKEGHVHMVDKDFVAVEYAQKNVEVNNLKNCEVYLSNGFSHIDPKRSFSVIISNLPAKVGKEMLEIFISDTKKHLKPGGKLYVVTVSGLKDVIKRLFEEKLGNWKKMAGSRNYVISLAMKK